MDWDNRLDGLSGAAFGGRPVSRVTFVLQTIEIEQPGPGVDIGQ